MSKKILSLSLLAHVLFAGMMYFYAYQYSGHILPFSENADISGAYKSEASPVKDFLRTQAQTISQSALNKEIAAIKQAQIDQREAKVKAEKAHQKKLAQLANEQKKLLTHNDKAKKELSDLENHKKTKKKQLKELNQEVAKVTKLNEEQKLEQKKLKREQSFAQNVLKESLYSDGSILRTYRENLGAHISSYWKKSQLSSAHQEAECILEIVLLPTRRIGTVKVKTTSGNAVFDNNAIAAVRRAEPFPQIGQISQDKLPNKIMVVFKQDGCGVVDATS